ncbi:MAG: RNA polymerase sigma factor [Bacteroidales bacterium]|nr:RNA polymerase sigma factor [Bacteroidales bacterium]
MTSEKEIVDGCKAGKEKYQKLLYEKFSSKLMGICLRYAGNQMEAEDILQDAFIRIFVNIDSFRGDGSLEGWLRKIVTHTAINAYRKSISKGFEVDIDDLHDNIEDVTIPSTDGLTVKLLTQLIEELPPGYRTVFNLYEIDGYSHNEISEMLGCAPVTVRTQLHKAKETLKKKIESLLLNKNEIII